MVKFRLKNKNTEKTSSKAAINSPYDEKKKLKQPSLASKECVEGLQIPMCSLVNYSNMAQIELVPLNFSSIGMDKMNAKVAMSFNNIGIAHHAHGRFDDAILHYCKALEVLKQQGQYVCSSAVIYCNIGAAMCAKGLYDDGLAEYKKALEIFKQKGENNNAVGTANCYNNMGIVLQKQEHYKDAMVQHNKALVIRTRVLGKHHPATLKSIGTILGDPQAMNQM